MKTSQYPQMRAVVKDRNGLFLRTMPLPIPKKDEILIKVALAGYCRTDAFVAQGKIKTKTPLILGHEFSGVVEKVGERIKRFKKGDRVAVMPILPDRDGHYSGPMLGVDRHGAFAEYTAVSEIAVYKIPKDLGFKEAAYLEPIAASLAVLKAPIVNNQRGVILGDDRIAKLTQRVLRCFGFKSAAIVSFSKAKNLRDNSFDFAIETFPTAENFSHLIRIVKPGGVIILKSRVYVPVAISIGKIVRKNLNLYGTYYGDFKQGVDLILRGDLKIKDIFGPVLDLEKAIKILKGDIRKYGGKKIFFKP